MTGFKDIALVGAVVGGLYILWGMGKDLYQPLQDVGGAITGAFGGVQDVAQDVAQAAQETQQAASDVILQDPGYQGIAEAAQEGGPADIFWAAAWKGLGAIVSGLGVFPPPSPPPSPEPTPTPEQQELVQSFYSGETSMFDLVTQVHASQQPTQETTPTPTPIPTGGLAALPGILDLTEHKVRFSTEEISRDDMEKLLQQSGRNPEKFKWLSGQEAYYWFT